MSHNETRTPDEIAIAQLEASEVNNTTRQPFKDRNGVLHIDSRYTTKDGNGDDVPTWRIIAAQLTKAARKQKHLQRFGQNIPKDFLNRPKYC